MVDTTQNQLVADIAREVVSQMAPRNLDNFDERAEEFLRDPRQVQREVRRAAKGREKEGAFGGSEIVITAPIALTVSHAVIHFLKEPVVKAGLAALLKSLFVELIKKIFKEAASKPKLPSAEIKLTRERLQEQLQAAKELGIKVAKESGLDDDRATSVVNIIIEYLAATVPSQRVNSEPRNKT